MFLIAMLAVVAIGAVLLVFPHKILRSVEKRNGFAVGMRVAGGLLIAIGVIAVTGVLAGQIVLPLR